jgi:hypothetical protein
MFHLQKGKAMNFQAVLFFSILWTSSTHVDGFAWSTFGVGRKATESGATPPQTIPQHRTIPYKHLFRHYDDISMDCWLRCAEPEQFLQSCGYTKEEINEMAAKWPGLLQTDVHDQLAPHVRFIVKAMQGGTGDLMWASEEDALKGHEDEECPPQEDATPRHQLKVSELGKTDCDH